MNVLRPIQDTWVNTFLKLKRDPPHTIHPNNGNLYGHGGEGHQGDAVPHSDVHSEGSGSMSNNSSMPGGHQSSGDVQGGPSSNANAGNYEIVNDRGEHMQHTYQLQPSQPMHHPQQYQQYDQQHHQQHPQQHHNPHSSGHNPTCTTTTTCRSRRELLRPALYGAWAAGAAWGRWGLRARALLHYGAGDDMGIGALGDDSGLPHSEPAGLSHLGGMSAGCRRRDPTTGTSASAWTSVGRSSATPAARAAWAV